MGILPDVTNFSLDGEGNTQTITGMHQEENSWEDSLVESPQTLLHGLLVVEQLWQDLGLKVLSETNHKWGEILQPL